MIDIHCHILPGVDDGPQDMEVAIELALQALDNGVKTIIATPHFIEGAGYERFEENYDTVIKLREELDKRNIDLDVKLGNEVFITHDVLKLLDRGDIATLNDSRYMLIEMSLFDIPIYVENLIYELRLRGIVPIIAHPERCMKIVEAPNILYSFISKGALIQLNLPSLEGRYGQAVKETAEILLSHDMVHFAAMDAHLPRTRSFRTTKNALSMLRNIVGKEKAEKLIMEHPRAVIEDREIVVEAAREYMPEGKIRKFLKKLF